MKRVSVSAALFFVACALLQAQTGAENIIKQRAKDLRDQNNAAVRGTPPPGAPPARPASPAQPVQPSVAPLNPHQQALGQLQSQLAALRPGSETNDASRQKLTRSLVGVAQGKKPQAQLTSNLANALTESLRQKLLATPTRSRLLQNLSAVMNAGKFAPAQLDDTIADIQLLLKNAGVDEKSAARTASAARAVAADLRKTAP